jgi:hypothetical protein
MNRLWFPASLYHINPFRRPYIREITATMLENPAGESRYELNCTFAAVYLSFAYRDIGKGREQDAEAL